MKKSQLEITAYYEVEGDLWWEGKATKNESRHYTHDQDQRLSVSWAPKPIKKLTDVMKDIIRGEEEDFQPGSVYLLWLVIEITYRKYTSVTDMITRTRIYTFEPDPARYPDYFVEM